MQLCEFSKRSQLPSDLDKIASTIRMEVSKIPKYRKLTKADRILIAQWRNQGVSCRAIAKLLGRHVSTVSWEIKNNSFKSLVYEPLHA